MVLLYDSTCNGGKQVGGYFELEFKDNLNNRLASTSAKLAGANLEFRLTGTMQFTE